MEYYHVDLTDGDLNSQVIHWEMDEYLEHRRSVWWYLVLAVIACLLGGLSAWVTDGGWLTGLSVAAMIGLLGIFTFKKPRRYKYGLSGFGIKIGSRLYDYDYFKTFSLIKDNGVAALHLIASQRFVPPLTIYLPADRDQAIVKMLSRYIAYTPRSLQWPEKLMQFLRF